MSNCRLHRHSTFDEVAYSAMLVVAQGQVSDARDRATRAEDHADACQDMVNATVRHPCGPRLVVVDGGA